MRRPWQLLILESFLLFAIGSVTHAVQNAGFVEGLWYNEDSFFAEDSVRLYVAIRNNTGAELAGTVTFYDNDKIIAKKAINALDERIVESWADWTPSYGEHTVRAELSRLELNTAGGETTKTTVSSSLAEDIMFVDYDTDGDGIGNEADTDDDGDGMSDEEEVAAGTNPLIFDEPEVAAAEGSNTDKETGGGEAAASSAEPTSPNNTEGLERYLTPSRADTLLAGVTTWTEATKEKIDDYRAKRSHKKAVTENDPILTVNADGFGEAVRSTDKNKAPEKPGGFMGDLITFIATLLSGLMTAVLATTSWTLSYPMLIQVSLLLGILYALYRLAKHFGQRA